MPKSEGEPRALGETAKTSMMSNIQNTVRSIKRYIGRSLLEPDLKNEEVLQMAQVVDGEREVAFKVNIAGEEKLYEATKMCSMMFQDLRAIAELECKAPVLDCVIGVPGYWSDRQRRALHDAATMAGFKVMRLLSEPTASAVAYGCNPKRELPKEGEDPLNVMICDMGHSNFQVSMCQFVKGKVTVLGQVADANFGARNFDQMLLEHFAALFKETKKVDIMSNKKATARLLAACEKCKMLLSANSTANVNVECIMNDVDVSGNITREELEAMAKPLLDRAMESVNKLMLDLDFKPEQVNSVELLGGGTRIPCVARGVTDLFGEEKIARTLISSEPVARGCALSAAMISPAFKVFDFSIKDIVTMPVSLSWKTEAGAAPPAQADGEEEDGDAMQVDDGAAGEEKTMVVFEKGCANPTTKVITFQRREPFELLAEYTNQEDIPEGCDKFIGKFKISGIVSEDGEPKKTKVKMKLDPNGLVQIESADVVETYYVEVVEEVPKPAVEEKEVEKKEGDAEPAEEDAAPAEEAPPSEDAPPSEADVAAEAAPEPEKKRKKKTKKTPLKVDSTTWGIGKDAMEVIIQELLDLEMQDKLIADTLDRKNAVESYVYETRDAVDMNLREFISDDDRSAFVELLNATEDWLYGDGEYGTKSDYVKKLEELKVYGDPVYLRSKEAEMRPEAIVKLEELIAKANEFVASEDEKFAHIEPEERAKVTEAAKTARDWLEEKVAAQEGKAKTVPPAMLVSEIEAQMPPLSRQLNTTMSKPKPKPPPPPAEEKKEEEKKEGVEAKEGEGEAPAEDAAAGEEVKEGTDPDKAEDTMDVD
jgi:heat shock protein 4